MVPLFIIFFYLLIYLFFYFLIFYNFFFYFFCLIITLEGSAAGDWKDEFEQFSEGVLLVELQFQPLLPRPVVLVTCLQRVVP